MEALFSLTLASFEAWILILCIIVFIGIYLFDGITLIQRVIIALKPHKRIDTVSLSSTEAISEVTSPLLEPIAPEEVEAHEAEKIRAEEEHEQEVLEAELLEERLIEEVHAELREEEQGKLQEKTIETEEVEIQKTKDIAQENNKETGKEEIKTESGDNFPDVLDDTSQDVMSAKEGIGKNSIEELSSGVGDTTVETPITELPETTREEKVIQEEKKTADIAQEEQKKEETIIAETRVEKKVAGSRHTEKLYAIVTEVKTLIARSNIIEARTLIIEGLAYDKNHRELNLILGSLYESERQPQKAEYVYKDLALIYPEDGEILERLANILIIEKRYDLALEIYKKISSLMGETEGSLYIMTHLAHELGHNEELYAYARRYQKNWPNNPDILTLLAQAEIALGERQAAIQTLIKLKNLTPYNNEIMETIAKLTMEEELAGNFGIQ